ncbi:MAG: sugar phosphate isomerase/epimerase [Planctomycetes bacterium]|nr:sugar phosphate isomerase/epimerase [Planctomycetota bacterium]
MAAMSTKLIFGVSSTHFNYDNLPHAFEKCLGWGMNHIEFFCSDIARRKFGRVEFGEIARLAQEHRFTVGYHPHYVGACDLGRAEPTLGLAAFHSVLDDALFMAARFIIVHLGTFVERQTALEKIVRATEAVLPRVEREGMMVCFEDFVLCHGPNALGDRPDDFEFLFSRVGAKCVGMNLDYGHGHITGHLYEYLRRFGSRLVYTHIQDNDGVKDQHIGVGFGTIDWPKAIRETLATGFRGPFTVEYLEKYAEVAHPKLKALLFG